MYLPIKDLVKRFMVLENGYRPFSPDFAEHIDSYVPKHDLLILICGTSIARILHDPDNDVYRIDCENIRRVGVFRSVESPTELIHSQHVLGHWRMFFEVCASLEC